MNPSVKGAFWMLGAIASFTSMAVAGRAVSFELDTFEIMMYRSFIGILIVLIVSSVARTRSQITTRTMHIHLVRNIFHFSGQNLWFYSITVIPLAQVFALEFTMPIWVILLAPLVLGERITRMHMLVTALGFIGILIVTRPNPDSFEWGLVTSAAAAIGFAGSALFTRLLTRTETITCILFWLTVIQAIFGILCAGYDFDIALPSAESVPWLILIGCAGLLAHFCLTTALSLAPASVVIPFDFARLPLIAIVGMVLYDEPVDIYVILGAALIFGANYLNIWSQTRKKRVAA